MLKTNSNEAAWLFLLCLSLFLSLYFRVPFYNRMKKQFRVIAFRFISESACFSSPHRILVWRFICFTTTTLLHCKRFNRWFCQFVASTMCVRRITNETPLKWHKKRKKLIKIFDMSTNRFASDSHLNTTKSCCYCEYKCPQRNPRWHLKCAFGNSKEISI